MSAPDPVVCAGAPREFGLSQGAALRARIAGARAILARLEVLRLERPWYLPFPAFRLLAERKVERLLAGPLARDYPDMAGRLAGLCEGSGQTPKALLLMNALEAFMSSLRDAAAAPVAAVQGCSAVAVRGSRSAGGEPFLARNFDYIPLVQPFHVLRDSRPEGGLRSLDFTVAPLAGAVDGMNEKGLCIAYNYAFTTDKRAPTAPISMAIAEALASCATAAEAAERIASRPRWGGGLLMLADASGDIASLELSGTRSRLRRPEAGSDVLYHTNAFWTPEMRAVEVPRDCAFTERAPEALRGERVHASAESRDARLARVLDGNRALSPQDLAAVLSDHGGGADGDKALCVHSAYWNTTTCMQYFPRSRRLRVDFAPPCRAAWRDFSLA